MRRGGHRKWRAYVEKDVILSWKKDVKELMIEDM